MVINRIRSVAPGAKKYIDIGKVTNNMVVDVDKITFFIIFRPHFYVRNPLKLCSDSNFAKNPKTTKNQFLSNFISSSRS